MNITEQIQKEIIRQGDKPTVALEEALSQSAPTVSTRQFAGDIRWRAWQYNYNWTTDHAPTYSEMVRAIPATKHPVSYDLSGQSGYAINAYHSQYDSIMYSTLLIVDSSVSVNLMVSWTKYLRIEHEHSGTRTVLIDTSTSETSTTSTLLSVPLTSGQNRIDVLTFTDDSNGTPFSIGVDTGGVLANAVPSLVPKFARGQGSATITGDDTFKSADDVPIGSSEGANFRVTTAEVTLDEVWDTATPGYAVDIDGNFDVRIKGQEDAGGEALEDFGYPDPAANVGTDQGFIIEFKVPSAKTFTIKYRWFAWGLEF